MAKKKISGHYCKICGERKANEKFSGKGHAKHICKVCDGLPQERKNELQILNRLASVAMKYPRKREDWELLEKYAKNNKYPEAREFSQSILDMNRSKSEIDDDEIGDWEQDKLSFSEFDEFAKGDIMSAIEDDIWDWISYGNGELPNEKSKQQILKNICTNMAFGNGNSLILNDELNNVFDTTLKEIVADLEKEDEDDL